MKPTKFPAREKTMRKEKQKKEEKSKNLKILLFAHARTSQPNVLHLDQKAVKCTNCKRFCGKI